MKMVMKQMRLQNQLSWIKWGHPLGLMMVGIAAKYKDITHPLNMGIENEIWIQGMFRRAIMEPSRPVVVKITET